MKKILLILIVVSISLFANIENIDIESKKILDKYKMSYETNYKDINLKSLKKESEIYNDMNQLQGLLFNKYEFEHNLKIKKLQEEEYERFIEKQKRIKEKEKNERIAKKQKNKAFNKFLFEMFSFFILFVYIAYFLSYHQENKKREV